MPLHSWCGLMRYGSKDHASTSSSSSRESSREDVGGREVDEDHEDHEDGSSWCSISQAGLQTMQERADTLLREIAEEYESVVETIAAGEVSKQEPGQVQEPGQGTPSVLLSSGGPVDQPAVVVKDVFSNFFLSGGGKGGKNEKKTYWEGVTGGTNMGKRSNENIRLPLYSDYDHINLFGVVAAADRYLTDLADLAEERDSEKGGSSSIEKMGRLVEEEGLVMAI